MMTMAPTTKAKSTDALGMPRAAPHCLTRCVTAGGAAGLPRSICVGGAAIGPPLGRCRCQRFHNVRPVRCRGFRRGAGDCGSQSGEEDDAMGERGGHRCGPRPCATQQSTAVIPAASRDYFTTSGTVTVPALILPSTVATSALMLSGRVILPTAKSTPPLLRLNEVTPPLKVPFTTDWIAVKVAVSTRFMALAITDLSELV